jgi:hypothetical protein
MKIEKLNNGLSITHLSLWLCCHSEVYKKIPLPPPPPPNALEEGMHFTLDGQAMTFLLYAKALEVKVRAVKY